MADELTPERVRWALADPAYGPRLRALVHDVSGFSAGGADEYLWREEDEPRIRELVDEALEPKAEPPEEKALDTRPEAGRKPGRRKGSEVPISDATVLEVLRLIVEENARPRAIADATDGPVELSFVNRIKAGVIVKWAEQHPVKAHRAVDRQEIPDDFPATDGGRLLPKP